ncbi:MAG: AAA family ATPase [Deltaproteobacteria bacterium]|nr:AAA family ATPase [Deltaproteobacteria bacterium]
MRIVRLEIFGFKSFVERFILNLDTNVVGIVGPNGCGKSNIVDALRWVLGETNARQLRGGVLEDLIFNGSDARRPLGMCEVSITLRNTSSSPVNYALRLKELEEAEIDDLVVPNLDLELGDTVENESLEPSASVKRKYVAKSSSLTDIPGLFDATEVQLTRRLYRSEESEYFINKVSCRLSDMVEFYRLIGLGARGLSIVQQGQISQIITRKPVERRELLEEAAGISGFRARIEVAERKLDKTSQNLLRLSDIITEVEKQVKTLKRQATRAEQRGELKAKLKDCELTLFQTRSALIRQRLSSQESSIDAYSSEREENERLILAIDAECEKVRSELTQLDITLVDIRSERDRVSDLLNKEKAKENALRIDFTRLEEKLKSIKRQQQEIAERKSKLIGEYRLKSDGLVGLEMQKSKKTEELQCKEEELVKYQTESTSHKSSEGDKKTKAIIGQICDIEKLLETMPNTQTLIRNLETRQKESDNALVNLSNVIHKMELYRAAITSELSALEKHVNDLTKVALNESAGDKEFSGSDVLLGSCFIVPNHLQLAVQAVIGEYANFIVTHDCQDYAYRYCDRSKNNEQKLTRIGFVQHRKEYTCNNIPSRVLASYNATYLVKEIQVKEGFEAVADIVLENVILFTDLHKALAFQHDHLSESSGNIIAVTLKGEVVTAWGWYLTTGQGVSLSFGQRIEELNQELLKLEGDISNNTESLSSHRKHNTDILSNLFEARESARNLYNEQKKLSELKEELRKYEREINLQRINKERDLQNVVRVNSNELQSIINKIDNDQRRVSELNDELKNIDISINEQENNLNSVQEEFLLVEENILKFSQAAQSGDSLLAKLYGQYGQIQGRLKEIESKRDWLVGELAHTSQRVEEVRRKSDAAGKSETSLKIEIERGKLEISMLFEDIERFYPGQAVIPPEGECSNILMSVDGEVADYIEKLSSEAKGLRARIEREGDVDPASIELFQQEKTRLDVLTKQYNDLNSAKKMLEDTIRELKTVSKERFVETFDFVSKKFEDLVPLLFGGGSGRLDLINPQDPLTSGVEISVRPPGKKLKTLELMSGGEKALAATALLFSVFLFKPSPICVLDEVDAPLDDANLARFLDLVREIANDTQFLVITHNKQTMAAVDKLVGITMQEKGVTTALAVKFEQYEKEELTAQA